MKFAVAYLSFFDNDLKLIDIVANNPITALVEGARIMMDATDDINEWLNGFLEKPVQQSNYASRIKEIQDEFTDSDQVITVMRIS